MTKSLILLVFSLFLLSFTSACSPDIKNAEQLIEEIGKVTLDSTGKIEAAETAYNALDDKQKEKVENFNLLEKAKGDYLFLLAKSVYDDIKSAADKTSENMSMYQEAWHYGIYEDEDTISLQGLADELNITSDELDTAVKAIGYSEDVLNIYYKDNFSTGLWIVDEVFKIRGSLTAVDDLLASAKDKLKTIESNYPDYENYKALVDYYSKVKAFYDFSIEHNESYESFTDKVQGYEKAVDDRKSELDYAFGD